MEPPKIKYAAPRLVTKFQPPQELALSISTGEFYKTQSGRRYLQPDVPVILVGSVERLFKADVSTPDTTPM
jgi:hypothetical protein